jgi:two-component sensor histidine kinase
VASWDEYGFGLRLVSMMAKQLKGILTIERAEGTKIILEFDYSET